MKCEILRTLLFVFLWFGNFVCQYMRASEKPAGDGTIPNKRTQQYYVGQWWHCCSVTDTGLYEKTYLGSFLMNRLSWKYSRCDFNRFVFEANLPFIAVLLCVFIPVLRTEQIKKSQFQLNKTCACEQNKYHLYLPLSSRLARWPR